MQHTAQCHLHLLHDLIGHRFNGFPSNICSWWCRIYAMNRPTGECGSGTERRGEDGNRKQEEGKSMTARERARERWQVKKGEHEK